MANVAGHTLRYGLGAGTLAAFKAAAQYGWQNKSSIFSALYPLVSGAAAGASQRIYRAIAGLHNGVGGYAIRDLVPHSQLNSVSNQVSRHRRGDPERTRDLWLEEVAVEDDMGVELKYFDSEQAVVACNDTDNIHKRIMGPLNLIRQGYGAENRDGRQVNIRMAEVSGYVHCNAASAEDGIVLVCLVIDTQCNGLAPAITDIFDLTTDLEPFSRLAMGYGHRFQVVDATRLSISRNISSAINYREFRLVWSGSLETNYVTDTGTTADLVDIGFYVVCMELGVAALCDISYTARLRFVG
jgi:hypothetical protein